MNWNLLNGCERRVMARTRNSPFPLIKPVLIYMNRRLPFMKSPNDLQKTIEYGRVGLVDRVWSAVATKSCSDSATYGIEALLHC